MAFSKVPTFPCTLISRWQLSIVKLMTPCFVFLIILDLSQFHLNINIKHWLPDLDQHFKVTSVTETWLRQSVIYFFLCRPKIIDPLAWGIYWLSLLLWHFKDHSLKKYHFPFIFFFVYLLFSALIWYFYLVFCGRIVLNLFQLWYWMFTVLGFKNTWKVWKVL